ncbi:acyltransferase family protein [Mangrovibacterium marinum]|uniref:acyltransferase family protein n=1 Tax=Mangrovibacterium marinum TaxID=1639118 RepID=UPI002A18C9BD|nr:acyltransferase family protein [Mangrovibacterium marinum]
MRNITQKKNRDSNFELLRLVAIFLIICHHLVIKSAQTCGYTHEYSFGTDGVSGLIINSLCVCGVNIFLLISGWYGIKHIWPQTIRLVIDCFIYSLITNTFCVFVLGYPFSWEEFLYSCNFLNNWFVAAFIMFLFIVPLIERAIMNIDSKTLGYFIILMTLFNVIFGFCFGKLNTNGYNAINFSYIYLIGRYLKVQSTHPIYLRYASKGLILYILCAIPLIVGFIFLSSHTLWTSSIAQKFFGYNNPIVIISAVALFLPFSVLKFQNKFINEVAKGVFGIFILHTTTIFIHYRVNVIGNWYQQFGYAAILISSIIIFSICGIIAWLIEYAKNSITSWIVPNYCETNLYKLIPLLNRIAMQQGISKMNKYLTSKRKL